MSWFTNKKMSTEFEKSLSGAQAGNPVDMYNVGWSYSTGEGVEQDDTKAYEWFSAASYYGVPEAILALGFCFMFGKGVEKHELRALKFLTMAAFAGNEQAKDSLSEYDEWWVDNGGQHTTDSSIAEKEAQAYELESEQVFQLAVSIFNEEGMQSIRFWKWLVLAGMNHHPEANKLITQLEQIKLV